MSIDKAFDWQLVNWVAPDEPRHPICSYCERPLDPAANPLLLYNEQHWLAIFCEKCEGRVRAALPTDWSTDERRRIKQIQDGLAPGYWRNEISGILYPAIKEFLEGGELSQRNIAALRAYFRQWINAGQWDMNPHAGAEEKTWLAELRADIDGLTSRLALERWLRRAEDMGLGPL